MTTLLTLALLAAPALAQEDTGNTLSAGLRSGGQFYAERYSPAASVPHTPTSRVDAHAVQSGPWRSFRPRHHAPAPTAVVGPWVRALGPARPDSGPWEERISRRPTIHLVPLPIGTAWGDLSDAARDVLGSTTPMFMERDEGRLRRMRDEGLVSAEREVVWLDGDGARDAEMRGILEAGGDLALVAGTGIPCFFDPGWRLMRWWVEHGWQDIDVATVGMSSALDAALVLVGEDLRGFRFHGHFPEHYTAARRWPSKEPQLFYVRGHAVADFLAHTRRCVWVRRVGLFFDLRKAGRQRIWFGRPGDPLPAELADDPSRDVVAVVVQQTAGQLLARLVGAVPG